MIGINDVWRQFDTPFIKDWHVYIDEYEETLRKIVLETKSFVKGVIILTPFYIESNEKDQMRYTMDQYGHAVKRIAEETDCLYIDTQAAFNQVLSNLYPATIQLQDIWF
jgi:lysophospholipase L1-like esterase